MKQNKFNDVADYFNAGGNEEELLECLTSPSQPCQLPEFSTTEPSPVISVTPVTGTILPFATITANELQAKEFPEPEWIVPGLIPVGLSILGGRPKAGKSWLALNLGISVAGGMKFLGTMEAAQRGVLYLALEDSQRRLQRRQEMILRAEQIPAPPDLHFTTKFRRFDEGGFDDLRAYLQAQNTPSLVIIDTLARVRGKVGKRNATYASDYEELGELQEIAMEHNAAILVVHHTTKMSYEDPFDSISGTSGISGAADTLFVLARSPQLNGIALQARGRDIDEKAYAVKFDPTNGLWLCIGDAAEVKMSDERRAIIEVLMDLPEGETLTPKAISEATGQERNSTRKLLGKMIDAGEVEAPSKGQYKLPVTEITAPIPPINE